MSTENTKQPKLLKISNLLESKIRLLCATFPDNEWSGSLFYKELEPNVYEALDICLMDIGSSSFTSYEESPLIIDYRINHPELLENGVCEGLIHSHNRMAAFFSGTDESTIKKLAKDAYNYISLIVNNNGSYVARVTHKRLYKIYDLNNNETGDSGSVTMFYDCDVERPEVEQSNDSELIERIEVLKEEKKKKDELEMLNRQARNGVNPYCFDFKTRDFDPYDYESYWEKLVDDRRKADKSNFVKSTTYDDKDLLNFLNVLMSFNVNLSILNKKQYDFIYARQLAYLELMYGELDPLNLFEVYDTLIPDIEFMEEGDLKQLQKLLKKFPKCALKDIVKMYIEDKLKFYKDDKVLHDR